MRVIDIRWHLWALGERATGYQQWQRDEQQKRLDPRSGSDVRSDSLSESVATFLSHSVIWFQLAGMRDPRRDGSEVRLP